MVWITYEQARKKFGGRPGKPCKPAAAMMDLLADNLTLFWDDCRPARPDFRALEIAALDWEKGG